jgi:hypothetical protein
MKPVPPLGESGLSRSEPIPRHATADRRYTSESHRQGSLVGQEYEDDIDGGVTPWGQTRLVRESYCPVTGQGGQSERWDMRDAGIRRSRSSGSWGGRSAARRGPGGRAGREAAGGVGADAAPLAAAVRRFEGR